MKAIFFLHNKGGTPEDLLKENKADFPDFPMCFHFSSNACEISIKMRKPKCGFQPGIR